MGIKASNIRYFSFDYRYVRSIYRIHMNNKYVLGNAFAVIVHTIIDATCLWGYSTLASSALHILSAFLPMYYYMLYKNLDNRMCKAYGKRSINITFYLSIIMVFGYTLITLISHYHVSIIFEDSIRMYKAIAMYLIETEALYLAISTTLIKVSSFPFYLTGKYDKIPVDEEMKVILRDGDREVQELEINTFISIKCIEDGVYSIVIYDNEFNKICRYSLCSNHNVGIVEITSIQVGKTVIDIDNIEHYVS